MLILCDSGILLRLFEPRDPEHAIIRQAIELLDVRGDELVTAPQNVAEFWNVCTGPGSARGGFGLSIPATVLRLEDIEKKFGILDEPSGMYAIWRQLVIAHFVQGKQVHDTRLAALMRSQSIVHILTLNGSDFARYPGIVVMSPADLVAAEVP
jgi:predicted nucleic acid-binding protein